MSLEVFKKIIRCLGFTVLLAGWSTAQSEANPVKALSEEAQVVLFTCQPGHELYAGFGHSALWVSDPSTQIDRLFNYGTFDFSTPNFYLKFIRGRLDYQLSVTSVQRFLAEYSYRGIGVYGQTLNLNLIEKQRIYELLENNLLPQNRNYRYDYFLDNCATRIRDIVEKAAEGDLTFHLNDQHYSYRELLLPYLEQAPWTRLGISFILGIPADREIIPYGYMYLPDFLQEGFESARVKSGLEERRLVSNGREYLPMMLEFGRIRLLDPEIVFFVLLVLVVLITIVEIRKSKHFKWLDYLLMTISLVAGIFLFLMWVATDHQSTDYNLNCLWLIPAQLVFLFLLKKKSNALPKVFLGLMAYTFFVSVIQWIWPQYAEISFSILNLVFCTRYFGHYLRLKKRKANLG